MAQLGRLRREEALVRIQVNENPPEDNQLQRDLNNLILRNLMERAQG